MLAGFSKDEILHELFVAPRAALIPLPDTQIIERPGWWQLVTPSLRHGGLNEVMCTELADADADAVIDAALAPYQKNDAHFRWTLVPGSQPADIAERLARRGLIRSEALAMARHTADVPPPDAAASGLSVEAVTLANVDDYTRVMAEGWHSDPAPLDAQHRRMLAKPEQRLFVVRKDGAAVAAGSYVALRRSAYFFGAVTLPAYRKHGIYRELVHARLRHAAEQGLKLATTLARAGTSAPILTQLGFALVSPIPLYVNFQG